MTLRILHNPPPRQPLLAAGLLLAVFLSPWAAQARAPRVILIKSDRVWQEYEETARVIATTLRNSELAPEVEETFLETDPERAQPFWRSLNQKQPDLLVTVGTPASRSALQYAGNTPLIFTLVLDNPAASDANSSPSRTGDGITLLVPVREQLQMIRQALPEARRVGLLHSRSSAAIYKAAAGQAEEQGLRLEQRMVNGERDVPAALRSLLPLVDVVWMPPDNLVYDSRIIRFILLECFQNSVPIVAAGREVAEAGTPLALGVDYADIGRQTAEMALRRLSGRGGQVSDIQPPRRVLLYINDLVASSLGLNIPKAVRDKAVVVRNGGR